MAASEGGGRRWLAWGCFGCLGIVALVVLAGLALFGTAWLGAHKQEVAERTLAPQVRGPATVGGEQPGTVVLKMNSGELRVEAGKPGESLRVDATYDAKSCTLEERMEAGDERWTYELEFTRKGSMLMAMLKTLLGGTGSRVVVHLPPDVPLDLRVEVQQGAAQVDLGGLWLESADLRFSQGGFELDVGDPLREPLESLVIQSSMGGFAARNLGDASPRRLEVEVGMGGMDLDLRGDWQNDAEISIRTSQGGAAVHLPRGVNIVGIEDRGVAGPDEQELARPTLTFSVSASHGEIEFD